MILRHRRCVQTDDGCLSDRQRCDTDGHLSLQGAGIDLFYDYLRSNDGTPFGLWSMQQLRPPERALRATPLLWHIVEWRMTFLREQNIWGMCFPDPTQALSQFLLGRFLHVPVHYPELHLTTSGIALALPYLVLRGLCTGRLRGLM